MKKLTLIALLLSTTCAFAQTKYTVNKALVTYTIKHMGFENTGSFGGFVGDVSFDKTHLSTSSITASVDVKTVNSDDESRDEHIKDEDYFDVAHYPKISMRSVSFVQKGGNNFIGQFEVTIKGKTKTVAFPFSYVQTGTTARFKGSFKINRLDFNIGDSSLVLGNEVTITVVMDTTVAAS